MTSSAAERRNRNPFRQKPQPLYALVLWDVDEVCMLSRWLHLQVLLWRRTRVPEITECPDPTAANTLGCQQGPVAITRLGIVTYPPGVIANSGEVEIQQLEILSRNF